MSQTKCKFLQRLGVAFEFNILAKCKPAINYLHSNGVLQCCKQGLDEGWRQADDNVMSCRVGPAAIVVLIMLADILYQK